MLFPSDVEQIAEVIGLPYRIYDKKMLIQAPWDSYHKGYESTEEGRNTMTSVPGVNRENRRLIVVVMGSGEDARHLVGPM